MSLSEEVSEAILDLTLLADTASPAMPAPIAKAIDRLRDLRARIDNAWGCPLTAPAPSAYDPDWDDDGDPDPAEPAEATP